MNMDLTKITSITEYLDKLDEIKDKSLILIVVKDNVGYWLNEEIQTKLYKLGLSQSLIHEDMVGYVTAISNGIVICEQKSPKDGIEEYQGLINGKKIYLLSKPYLSGNTSSIQIDGKEYSNNSRGLNIVVYDNESNCVVDRVSFDTHVKEYNCIRAHDVGVVGVWFGANYGSLINGYATYRILNNLGKSVLMIQKPGADERDGEIHNTHNARFVNKFYPTQDVSNLYSIEKMSELNRLCDTFLAGSDQIWHWNQINYFKYSMLLNFVEDDKRKISFASSFGHIKDSTPIEYKSKVKKLLDRFTAISVREKSAEEICQKEYGIEAHTVIDPVFCLGKNGLIEIAEEAKIELPEKYLLAYILDPTEEKNLLLKRLHECLGINMYIIPDGFPWKFESNKEKLPFENVMTGIGAEDVINFFRNATFIVTDSYHGTCFSIIFNKPFIAIANRLRGYARFEDILGRFGLKQRLIYDNDLNENIKVDQFLNKSINYQSVNAVMEREVKKAISWLKKALNTPPKKKELFIDNKQGGIVVSDVDGRLVRNPEFIKIRILASLLHDYGVKHIVLSPGGRDIPLVRIFEYNEKDFILHRVTDERSAAYYGLGIASAIQQPVACVCTSGTAASNYLPAVTEAFYTGIPLIVITADRLGVYLNQGEDQTIPQKEIYKNVVKKEISLPEGEGYRVEYQVRRDVSDCILESMHHTMGPVHINVPVDDNNVGFKASRDAWRLLPKVYPHLLRVGYDDGEKRMLDWVKELKKSQRILVVYGQQSPLSVEEKKYVEAFASKYNCVIVTEHISNYEGIYALKPANLLLSISQKDFDEQLSPDILITVGGKRFMNDPLTFKIRHGKKNIRHWSVSPDGKVKDFYFRLTSVIEMSQGNFFKWFSEHADSSTNNGIYYEQWRSRIEKYSSPINSRFNTNYLLEHVLPQIPSGSLLHFGVGITHIDSRKYDVSPNVECYCNMGTNGIDGCTSTFMGASVVNKNNLAFLIVGDLSFFYDMNSIWNKELTSRIRILLMNNKGSGLLRGTGLKAIASSHNTSAKGWVESVGFTYLSASDASEFNDKLKIFLSNNTEEPIFFEVFCE